MKIPIKKYIDDETLSWEERYKKLELHHKEETQWLISEVKRLEQIRVIVVTDTREDAIQYLKNNRQFVPNLKREVVTPVCVLENDFIKIQFIHTGIFESATCGESAHIVLNLCNKELNKDVIDMLKIISICANYE